MKYTLICFVLIVSCSKKDENELIITNQNRTIDSLKLELNDCVLQAQIMADILEEERIKNIKNEINNQR